MDGNQTDIVSLFVKADWGAIKSRIDLIATLSPSIDEFYYFIVR